MKKIRTGWQAGKLDDTASKQLLASLRTDSPDDVPQHVVELLNKGISPQSVYDSLFAAAGEMLMRQPGIIALHASTTTNAMHHAFHAWATDETRRLILLQNAAFLPMFRNLMPGRGPVGEARIDELTQTTTEDEGSTSIIEQSFANLQLKPMLAARQAFTYLENGGRPEQLINAARRLIYLKGTDSHDYKFSSAVLEDFFHASPGWRNRFLAASMFNLRGSTERDNSLVDRTRAALT